MSSPGGSRVRLVCTSCKTLCEVTIPAANPTSTKPVRYQVRCPNCKAINEPQNPLRAGAGKAVDPKRKVCLARATLSVARRLHLSAHRTCAGSAACSTCSEAAECSRGSRVAEEAGRRKLRRRTAPS